MFNAKSSNIPKFASFKPRTSAATEESSGDRDSGSVRSKHLLKLDKRESREHGERDRHKFSSSRSHSEKISSRTRGDYKNDSTCNFTIDWEGDQKNLLFGSLHPRSVPKYRRYGADRVLGAPPHLRIDRSLEDDKTIVLINSRSYKPQKKGKHIFSKIRYQKPRLLKPNPNSSSVDSELIESDFISLRPQKRRKITDKEQSGSEHEENVVPKYREITVNNSRLPPDDDSDFMTETDSESNHFMDIDSSVRKKNVILCRKVEEFPEDIDAWISLINHQDLMIQEPDDSRKVTQAMIRSTTEIKIHMYEKALKHSRSLQDRERLLVGLMSEGAKIWELKTQANRWEQISRDNIESLVLWTKYIDFKQSTFSSFQYEEVKNLHLQRFKLLSEKVQNQSEDTDKIYHELTNIILRASLFIREAGFCELAVAVWQSILEINFCGLEEDLPQSDLICKFKDFWESEVPRIGEKGARGWHHHMSAQGTSEVVEPIIDLTNDLLDKKKIFTSWVVAERLRSMTSRIPAKTLDEVAENDPYRVILFSDIEEFLLILPRKTKALHRLCINAFLKFCRLPELVDDSNNYSERWCDSFVTGDLLESKPCQIESHFGFQEKNNDCGVSQFSLSPFPNFVHSSESMFRGVIANQGTPNAFKERFSGDNGPISYDYVRNSLRLLMQSWTDDCLTEYYLSFEHINEPETIRKTSKSLLKQNMFSFRLYHAYALIEWSQGKIEVAENVFTAALNMGKDFSNIGQNDLSIMLWKSWIWAYFERKNELMALKLLVCIAGGTPNLSIEIYPTLLVRARQHLVSNRDYFAPKNPNLAVMYAECLAILEYLSNTPGQELASSNQRNIKSAMEIYSSMSTYLLSHDQTKLHEILLQSASRLLYCHSQNGPYRPALIREHLTNFLQYFPKNTVLISLYSWNESRLRIDNRVRNILMNIILLPENDALTSRLFAIRHEMIVGTVHSVKAAFEHSVASPATRLSAGLWRLYILYCIQTPQLRSLAELVWYRALRACPWAKELYITGFEKIGDVAEFSQMKSIWMVMEEKELRVHVDLLDLFQVIEDSKSVSPSQMLK